jgi:hypothetical protein
MLRDPRSRAAAGARGAAVAVEAIMSIAAGAAVDGVAILEAIVA